MPQPEPEPEADPPQTFAQLQSAYPDLEVYRAQPTTLTLYVGSFYPFQTASFGLGSDVRVVDRLRLSAILAGGFSSALGSALKVSAYGELSFGLSVARFETETTVELPIVAARFHRKDVGDSPVSRARVPASHSIEVEGGAFSGSYFLYRCTESCASNPRSAAVDASEYVTTPFAGVRYVYFRLARSKQAPFRSVSRFQLGIDALFAPFGAPDGALFNGRDKHPSHDPLGVRVQLKLPAITCRVMGACLGLNATGGYLPTPSDALVNVGLELY